MSTRLHPRSPPAARTGRWAGCGRCRPATTTARITKPAVPVPRAHRSCRDSRQPSVTDRSVQSAPGKLLSSAITFRCNPAQPVAVAIRPWWGRVGEPTHPRCPRPARWPTGHWPVPSGAAARAAVAQSGDLRLRRRGGPAGRTWPSCEGVAGVECAVSGAGHAHGPVHRGRSDDGVASSGIATDQPMCGDSRQVAVLVGAQPSWCWETLGG